MPTLQCGMLLCYSVYLIHESCGSVDFIHESCGSVDFIRESCGSVDLIHESCGSVDFIHESCRSVDFIHESCGSVDFIHESCGTKWIVTFLYQKLCSLLNYHMKDDETSEIMGSTPRQLCRPEYEQYHDALPNVARLVCTWCLSASASWWPATPSSPRTGTSASWRGRWGGLSFHHTPTLRQHARLPLSATLCSVSARRMAKSLCRATTGRHSFTMPTSRL